MKKNHRIFFNIILSISIFSLISASLAQNAVYSSVMWANASGTPSVAFTLNGNELTKSWAPGSSGGSGKKETISWDASFKPSEPLVGFSENFKVEPGSSSLCLLLGDFKKIEGKEMENLIAFSNLKNPTGFTKLQDGRFIRAALLKFSVPKEESGLYPIYLINGAPDSVINITFQDGKKFLLKYGEPQIYNSPVDVRIKVRVEAGEYKEVVAYVLDKRNRGGVFAFYKNPQDPERLQKMFVNLNSIESLLAREKNQGSEESSNSDQE